MGLQKRNLEDRIAVITGGGSGIGAAVALALAQEGAGLYLIGRRLQPLESVASKARDIGVPAVCYRVDLSLSSGQLELTRSLGQNLQRLDILIHSAALHNVGPVEDGNLSELDQLYHTNVRAPLALTQAFLPMLKAQEGQIVFINSSSGVVAKPMSAQYDATKHALKAIADSLRGEVNSYGVRVLSVYPGRTATDMQERLHRTEDKTYRPELLMQPADVASVIINALLLPRTAEVTDIHIRPMIKT
ncbi:SDR family NAD(P)-dependent oxidoreductase [Bradyrhizobium hipponense]|uniref:SDR family NAD(P)-dependent oxidoreductase n=1 Tax=Bradyrhizobium hipponense TaxID=2605638 RepID=A0A5S4YCF4_9BRAD|nr:SDR family NAD(P)-dependent oxidoreductase [Bradyrhizobium hipponense]TYO61364.1 SDR family NAD(P)-dependent oxidoreductase [Bradyrhizobium hipponense]